MRFLFMSDTHFTCNKDVRPSIWLNRLLMNKWDEIKEKVISEVKELKPDVIIHCGDFTHFGTVEDFTYGKTVLDATGIEWYAVPGNHDAFNEAVKKEMKEEFAITDGNSYYYSRIFGGIAVAFLDVCVAGNEKLFSIDGGSLNWLESFLKDNYDKIVFLVCHIPVRYDTVLSDYGTFMDKGMPIEGEVSSRHIGNTIGKIENVCEIRKIIDQNTNVKIVFSGHWHINSLHINKYVYYRIVPSVCEYPCEVVITDCDDKEIRIHNKAIGGLGLQKDSIIAEWNNTWVSGTQKTRNIMIPVI